MRRARAKNFIGGGLRPFFSSCQGLRWDVALAQLGRKLVGSGGPFHQPLKAPLSFYGEPVRFNGWVPFKMT